MSLVSLAIAYVIGFLVVNAHLAKFGISDIEFVSARYLLAAANFAFFLVCLYLFAGRAVFLGPKWLSEDLKHIPASGGSRKWPLIVFVHSLVALVFFCCFSAATFTTVALWQAETTLFYAVLGGTFIIVYTLDVTNLDIRFPRSTLLVQLCVKLAAICAFFITPKWENLTTVFFSFLGIALHINFVLDHLKRYKLTVDRATFTVIYSLLFLLVAALWFGALLYGRVSPKLGGARPVQVSVGLVESTRNLVPGLLAPGDKPFVEGLLIYQTSGHVYLQVKDMTVRLREADVTVITMRPEKVAPFSRTSKPATRESQSNP